MIYKGLMPPDQQLLGIMIKINTSHFLLKEMESLYPPYALHIEIWYTPYRLASGRFASATIREFRKMYTREGYIK